MAEPMEPHPEYDRVRDVVRSVQAPPALREHVAAQRERTLVRRMVVKRMKLAGALSAGAAVLGIVVGLLSAAGSTPSALEASRFASAAPETGAPPAAPGDPARLQVSVGDVTFPSWSGTPWRVSGARDDELDGRAARTVFYDLDDVRVGYTVVEGELAWPDDATERDGVRVLRRDGRLLAVWRAAGETCIIAAPESVGEDRLLAMTRY